MELKVHIDKGFMKTLQEKVGYSMAPADFLLDALTLFNWAVDEAGKGRIILSSNELGGDVHRLVMPSLSLVAARMRLAGGTPTAGRHLGRPE